MDSFNNEDILHIMNIYLEEWKHRETILWRQSFRFFYAVLIVSFLPFLAEKVEIELIPQNIHILFPIVGIAMSFIFLYVSLGCVARLNMTRKTYKNIMNLLPEGLRQVDKAGMPFERILCKPMGLPVSLLMFAALLCVSGLSTYLVANGATVTSCV